MINKQDTFLDSVEYGNMDDMTEAQRALKEMRTAQELANLLAKHYPGYPWLVNVSAGSTQGVVNIFNYAVSRRYGYVLHLTTVQNDPTLKCVILAGGEILERGELIRGEAQGEYAERIDGIPEKHQPNRLQR